MMYSVLIKYNKDDHTGGTLGKLFTSNLLIWNNITVMISVIYINPLRYFVSINFRHSYFNDGDLAWSIFLNVKQK